MRAKPKDWTGHRFGRRVVIGLFGATPHRTRLWLCRCDCGAEATARSTDFERGLSQSCGCLQREAVTKHGHSQEYEYKIWRAMLRRCENPKDTSYPRYGGRGIKVCERWHDFEAFLSDMGRQPATNLQIERKENSGDYEPQNCEWATSGQQARNRRRRADNSSGVTGVYSLPNGRYLAMIGYERRKIPLGTFDSLPDAAAARQQAEIRYGFNATHGR